jgi:hypothetical protein
MKKINFFTSNAILYLIIFYGFFATAQTPEQVRNITSSYNKQYLNEMAEQALKKSITEKEAAIEYAQARNIPISYTTKDSVYAELQKVMPDGTLIYNHTNNVDAAKSTRTNHLNIGGSSGYNLEGQNLVAYVWDGGHPRVSHQEYNGPGGNNRVSIIDGPIGLHYHSAHVVGTIAASGVVPSAKGMAPRSTVKTYEWNSDLGEATSATIDGMLLSNHSYGYGSNTLDDWYFGAYIDESRDWDNLMYNAPYYLMVKSAGNDGNDTHFNGQPLLIGYDMLSGSATSKNNLVVGAARDADVDNDGNLNSVNIVEYSSPGPTDDLRIKPDITGNGWLLYSTFQSSNNHYGTISGTSMATPNITGSLLLLQEHFNKINGSFMRAATLKGLALHTADDAGPQGPDVKWGWGLLNAKRAAETITMNGTQSIIQEMVLNEGQVITLQVDSNGLEDLQASISWTDLPGTPVWENLNSSTPTLVNDLDIRVIKNNDTFLPWRLVSVTNNEMGDNNVDPFERVDVASASGTYTIIITHKGNLTGGSQAFSLIVSGLQIECDSALVPENILVNNIKSNSASLSWNPFPGASFDLRYRAVNSSIWVDLLDINDSNYELVDLNAFTEYEVEVRAKCLEGIPSQYSEEVRFTTTYCKSFSSFPNPELYISNVNLNTINNSSSESSYSDFTHISTDLTMGQTYTISVDTHSNDSSNFSNYSAWIDYNKNGIFETYEKIFSLSTTAGEQASGTFLIPTDLNPLTTTMRVVMSRDILEPGPCEKFLFGEVEDYSINLKLPHTEYVFENDVWTPADPAGLSTLNDNILIVNGSTSFTTSISANNITIETNASLSVEKILNIAGDLSINGELIFVSSQYGNGEMGEVSEGSTITGYATVQHYMSSRRAYRMVSSAVSTNTSIRENWQEGVNNIGTDYPSDNQNPNPGFGTHITGDENGENGFDATLSGNPSMFYVSNQNFVAVNSTLENLQAGKPYLLFVRGDRNIDLSNNQSEGETVLRATGILHYGTQPTVEFDNVADGQFAMFGNPYQSTVDVNHLFENGGTNVNTGHYYIYDPTQATHGAYVTVNLPSGTNTGTSAANQYLQPGQGAQFQASGNNPSLTFYEDNKAPENFTSTSLVGNRLSADNMLTVQLFTSDNYNNNGPAHDSFGIIFDDNFSNDLSSEDAIKPMNFYENIGVDLNGTYLSIERRKIPQADEAFKMFVAGYQYTDYTLKLNIDGLEDRQLYLYDQFTGIRVLLNVGSTFYNFTVDQNDSLSTAPDRFYIETEARLGVEINDDLREIRLYPNPIRNNRFYIYAPRLKSQNVEIKVSDILGRTIYHRIETFFVDSLEIIAPEILKSGIYVVHLSFTDQDVNLRLIKF